MVQEYIERPHTIQDNKYDIRFYALVYGVSPLRIYLHKFALARFCQEAYEHPTDHNIKNLYIHKSNHAMSNYRQYSDD